MAQNIYAMCQKVSEIDYRVFVGHKFDCRCEYEKNIRNLTLLLFLFMPGISADAFLVCLSFGMIIRAAANAIFASKVQGITTIRILVCLNHKTSTTPLLTAQHMVTKQGFSSSRALEGWWDSTTEDATVISKFCFVFYVCSKKVLSLHDSCWSRNWQHNHYWGWKKERVNTQFWFVAICLTKLL